MNGVVRRNRHPRHSASSAVVCFRGVLVRYRRRDTGAPQLPGHIVEFIADNFLQREVCWFADKVDRPRSQVSMLE